MELKERHFILIARSFRKYLIIYTFLKSFKKF